MISTRTLPTSIATALFAVCGCVVGTAQNSFAPIRIRCAGPSYTDPQGQMWSADPGYAGGVPSSSTASISTTNLGPLYESSRSWNSAASPGRYSFTMPNGTYSVMLKFAETSMTQPGQRIFNVSINEQSVLTNFDIFASAGGANIALDKQYTVAVSSGELEIELAAVIGAAMMSAIQITATSAQSQYDVMAKIQPTIGATSFSLPDIPIVGTLRVYRNGLLLSDGNNYFLSDNQVWFQPGQSLQVTDLIQVLFKH